VGQASSAFRVLIDVVFGLLLAGIVVGVTVPVNPASIGPAVALGVTMLCVAAVVLIDWRLFKKP
jgi:hypothetical protein